MQSCQNLASGYIIQTSTSVEFHVFRSHMESGFDHLEAIMLNQCQHEPEEMAKLEQNWVEVYTGCIYVYKWFIDGRPDFIFSPLMFGASLLLPQFNLVLV